MTMSQTEKDLLASYEASIKASALSASLTSAATAIGGMVTGGTFVRCASAGIVGNFVGKYTGAEVATLTKDPLLSGAAAGITAAAITMGLGNGYKFGDE